MVVRRYSTTHPDGARLQEPRAVETILSRYRNLIILAITVVSQLLLLAWQVRTSQDVRLIRVWSVTAVTPMAGVIEALRRNTIGFLEDYFILLDVREQNRKLRQENSRLKIENVYYRDQLQTAEHAQALKVFQARTPSTTVAARVIGNGTASSAQVVFIDRGSTSGIERGMAVVTPDGVVGKVIAVYPLAAQVLLVTDPTFSVGIESQKGHVHGTLHCNGSNCTVEFIQNEESVQRGEWFFTSGEDRIFPKGFPVGDVSSVKPGQFMKEIHLNLSGAPGSADEVLVVLEGVHQQIPTTVPRQSMAKSLPPPPEDGPGDQQAPKLATEADKIRLKYEELGKQQNHQFGAVGSNIPNFNSQAPSSKPSEPAPGSGQPGTGQPAGGQAPAQSGGQTAEPKATPAKEAPKAPARPAIPPVLGARPESLPESPGSKAPGQVSPQPTGPVLPLGAPRKKPATAAQGSGSAPQ
jgi:rod shape-determining protein MreC